MDKKDLKLATYLDEAGDDPESGCKTLISHGILYTGLRHIWSSNICNISAIGHKRLFKILQDYNISTILIASDIGRNEKLHTTLYSEVDKAINICKYYNAPYLRVFLTDQEKSTQWITEVGKRCSDNNITPLFELLESHTYKPTDLAHLFSSNNNWKFLYDPVSVIARRNIDPFVKYWTLLKNYTSIIDIRDMKIGKGYKPAGFGDSKIGATIKDSISSNYNGWFMMEPSLGRKHGTAITKSDTFKHAIDGLEQILASVEQKQ